MADQVILTPSSAIPIRPNKWLFDQRLPTVGLALLAGREGVGKSNYDSWLAASVSRGTLPGEYFGTPRNVIVVAAEDDWETILAPRLIAAGADMDRIYRLTIKREHATHEAQISLPENLEALEAALKEVDPALVVISPLMSRLSGKLNSHNDKEVRQALEPLVALAFDYRTLFYGLIHLNKSITSDPLRAVMASGAFVAVARAVEFIARDPDDPDVRIVGLPKNNNGLTDYELGLRTFTIEQVRVGKSPEGEDVYATRARFGKPRDGTIEQVLDDTAGGSEQRTAIGEALEWLRDYLYQHGGSAPREEIAAAAAAQDIGLDALKRARVRGGIETRRTQTVPASSMWRLPGPQVVHSRSTPPTTPPTAPTAPTTQSRQSRQSRQGVGRKAAPSREPRVSGQRAVRCASIRTTPTHRSGTCCRTTPPHPRCRGTCRVPYPTCSPAIHA